MSHLISFKLFTSFASLLIVATFNIAIPGPCHAQKEAPDSYSLFEQPGRMVALPGGNRLSLYCSGKGAPDVPTVILETGFGGSAYAAWHELQPRLARTMRVCSYDRAGYGFSDLGNDLPRDIQHDVADLEALLRASGEPEPYILVGHSDGGHIIGAFTDKFPREIAGLVFLDAAILLDKKEAAQSSAKPSPELQKYFDQQLEQIRTCLERAQHATGPVTPRPGDFCLDSSQTSKLPVSMAAALARISARPENWRALLSEAEQHYLPHDDTWEASLLPHRWEALPIRVFTASVASLDDEHSAASYGLPITDHKAIAAARAGRREWGSLQQRICGLSAHCKSYLIPIAEHEVQNAEPDQVASSIRELARQTGAALSDAR